MRFMQSTVRMKEISDRASAINLTVWRLCKEAGVDYASWSRWHKGEVSPTERVFELAMTKLEGRLREREFALYQRLAPRFDDQPARLA